MEEHSLEEIRTTKHTVKNNVFIKLFEDVRNVYKLYPILGRIPPLLSEAKVGDECRLFFTETIDNQ